MHNIEWRDVPGFEGFYEVNNLGLVRSFTGPRQNKMGHVMYQNGRVLMPKMSCDGYLMLKLSVSGRSKIFRINILVATVFIPNPDNKPCVDHRNAVRWDNRVENLRWSTVAENTNFSYGRAVNEGERLIIQKCDMNDNVLAEYESVSAVTRDGYGSRVVNRVVLGQRKHAYGFRWKRITVGLDGSIVS